MVEIRYKDGKYHVHEHGGKGRRIEGNFDNYRQAADWCYLQGYTVFEDKSVTA